MEVGVKIMATCDFLLEESSHVYNGNWKDCRVLSDAIGRTVVSCKNFAIEGGGLSSLISIVEATFEDDSQIVVVSSDGVPVFRYKKRTHFGVGFPYGYEFLDDKVDWQIDILHLAEHADRL